MIQKNQNTDRQTPIIIFLILYLNVRTAVVRSPSFHPQLSFIDDWVYFIKISKKEFSKRYLTEASRQEILKMISNSMEKVAEKVCSRTFISPETNADRVLQIQRILDVVQVILTFIEISPMHFFSGSISEEFILELY